MNPCPHNLTGVCLLCRTAMQLLLQPNAPLDPRYWLDPPATGLNLPPLNREQEIQARLRIR